MKKIIVAGQYGVNSAGDDAGIIFLKEELEKKYKGNLQITVIDRHAEYRYYEKYNIKSVQNIEYRTRDESAGKWFKGFNYGDDKDIVRKLAMEIKGSDLLIIGIGNILTDITIDMFRGPIPYFAIMCYIANMYDIPIMLYGISVGPLNTEYGKRLSRMVLKQSDIITVRDKKSIEEINALNLDAKNVILLPDAVIGLNHRKVFDRNKIFNIFNDNEPIVGISLRDLGYLKIDGFESTYEDAIVSTCNFIIEEFNHNIMFVPQGKYEFGGESQNDVFISKRVAKKIRYKNKVIVLEDDLSIYELIDLYSLFEFCISTRLHSNVFASISSVPTVSINYNPKVRSFIEWLGLEKYCLNLEDVSIDNLKNNVLKLKDNLENEKNKIKEKVSEGKKQTQKYIELVINLLNDN